LHKDVYYNENSRSEWSTVERFVRFEAGNTYWLEVVGRPTDTKGETGFIEYRKLSITFYESISSYTVDSQNWNGFFNPKEIILEPGKPNLEIWSQTLVKDIKPTLLGNNISNCDVFN